MAIKGHRDMTIRLDGAAGTLVSLSNQVNQQSLARAVALLETTGMSAEEATFLPGLAGTTISINGYVDTTSEAIFGPLISDNTSVSKTVEFKAYGGRFYNGEVWMENVEISGGKDTLETFSAGLKFTGAVNRTSVTLA